MSDLCGWSEASGKGRAEQMGRKASWPWEIPNERVPSYLLLSTFSKVTSRTNHELYCISREHFSMQEWQAVKVTVIGSQVVVQIYISATSASLYPPAFSKGAPLGCEPCTSLYSLHSPSLNPSQQPPFHTQQSAGFGQPRAFSFLAFPPCAGVHRSDLLPSASALISVNT